MVSPKQVINAADRAIKNSYIDYSSSDGTDSTSDEYVNVYTGGSTTKRIKKTDYLGANHLDSGHLDSDHLDGNHLDISNANRNNLEFSEFSDDSDDSEDPFSTYTSNNNVTNYTNDYVNDYANYNIADDFDDSDDSDDPFGNHVSRDINNVNKYDGFSSKKSLGQLNWKNRANFRINDFASDKFGNDDYWNNLGGGNRLSHTNNYNQYANYNYLADYNSRFQRKKDKFMPMYLYKQKLQTDYKYVPLKGKKPNNDIRECIEFMFKENIKRALKNKEETFKLIEADDDIEYQHACNIVRQMELSGWNITKDHQSNTITAGIKQYKKSVIHY